GDSVRPGSGHSLAKMQGDNASVRTILVGAFQRTRICGAQLQWTDCRRGDGVFIDVMADGNHGDVELASNLGHQARGVIDNNANATVTGHGGVLKNEKPATPAHGSSR